MRSPATRHAILCGIAALPVAAAIATALTSEAKALPPSAPLRVGYSITFDATDGVTDGWTKDGASVAMWQQGAPTSGPMASSSGTKCYATELAGDYPDSADGSLVSPVFTLDGSTRPRIKFAHHMDSESAFDGGQLQVKRGAGAFVTIPSTDPGWLMNGPNDDSIDGLGGEPGWSGNPTGAGYSVVILDLFAVTATGLAGLTAQDEIQVRFHFGSDSSVTMPGWYIDDFQLVNGGRVPVKNYTGDTTGKPGHNRASESGALSSTTNTSFEAQAFSVPEDGTGAYTITSTWAGGQDGFLLLYRGAFDPADATKKFLAGDDDFAGITKSQIAGVNLTAGDTYVLVATGFGDTDEGAYSVKIEGPAPVRFLPGGPAFDAAFSAAVTEGETPLSVQFTDLSVGGATSWTWSFGDGVTSTAQSPLHVYREAGTFDVTLTISDATRTATVVEDGLVSVIKPDLPKRKDGAQPNACAVAMGASGARAAAGAWGPLAAAVAAMGLVVRRRRQDSGCNV